MKVTIADDIRGVFDILNGWAPTVIAGGCLRDMIHGVKFKDVDFIIEGKPDPIATNPDEILEGYWSGGYYGDAGCESIIDVFKGVTKTGTEYDVICVKRTYKDHIDNFDFGINQVWWDGQLHVTKKFVSDHLTETLNFTKPEYDIRNTRNRGIRIATKLGFTFQGVKYEKPKEMDNPCREVLADNPLRQYMQHREWSFWDMEPGNVVHNPRPIGQPIFAGDRFDQRFVADDAFMQQLHRMMNYQNEAQRLANQHMVDAQVVLNGERYRDWRNQQAVDRMNRVRQEQQERARNAAEVFRRMYGP